MSKKSNTIKLLEKLKIDRLSLTESNSFGFAAKTLELIKLSVGEKSIPFHSMQTLFYDRTVYDLERNFVSAQFLIVNRTNSVDGLYDSIIDSCIELVDNHGLYKHPSEKKNILGDFNNSEIWTLAGFFFLVSFSIGIVATKFGLTKIFDPNETHDNVQIKDQKEIQKDTLLPEKLKKNQKPTK